MSPFRGSEGAGVGADPRRLRFDPLLSLGSFGVNFHDFAQKASRGRVVDLACSARGVCRTKGGPRSCGVEVERRCVRCGWLVAA